MKRLTDKQQELANEFFDTLQEMSESGILIIDEVHHADKNGRVEHTLHFTNEDAELILDSDELPTDENGDFIIGKGKEDEDDDHVTYIPLPDEMEKLELKSAYCIDMDYIEDSSEIKLIKR